MKEEKGIALVTLAITVVVLLIILGVSARRTGQTKKTGCGNR